MRDLRIARRAVLVGVGALLVTPPVFAAATRPRVRIATRRGAIVVELAADKAPITCANFLRYVDAAKYDDATFYRAARTRGAPRQGTIVAQTAPKVHPYPPIAHESTTQTGLRHTTGTISLGRFALGSATSSFFICASPQPYLDAQPGRPGTDAHGDNQGYAAFGQVVEGMEVVRNILAMHTRASAPFDDQKGQWLDPPLPIRSIRRIA